MAGAPLFPRPGLNYGRALIVGGGRTGELVAHTNRGQQLDRTRSRRVCRQAGPAGVKTAAANGNNRRDRRHCAQHKIDHVFVALPLSRYGELPQIYQALSDVRVEVQLVPMFPASRDQAQLIEIDGVPFVTLRQDPIAAGPVSPNGDGCLSRHRRPDGPLSADADAGPGGETQQSGPVFYRQCRTGLAGRQFGMFKFRSMRVDAESQTGPVWAQRGDDRCTRLGRFIRRWSLDELPNSSMFLPKT